MSHIQIDPCLLGRQRNLPKDKRIYAATDMDHLLGEGPYNSGSQKEKIIYTSVSSSKQKANLNRRIEELKYSYLDHVVYKDIGSGLNYKRQLFTALLGRVYPGLVSEIILAYRDLLVSTDLSSSSPYALSMGRRSWFTMPQGQMMETRPNSLEIWPSDTSSLCVRTVGGEDGGGKDVQG